MKCLGFGIVFYLLEICENPLVVEKRADLVVVTKCPSNHSPKIEREDYISIQLAIGSRIKISFSTSIKYDCDMYMVLLKLNLQSFVQNPFVLVTGIADAKPLTEPSRSGIGAKYEASGVWRSPFVLHLRIVKKILSKRRLPVLTTEKDYVRLKSNDLKRSTFTYPYPVRFLADEDQFKDIISNQLDN